MRVWPEQDAIAVLSSTGVLDREIDASVKELRPVGGHELAKVYAAVLDYAPGWLLGRRMHLVADGRTDRTAWALGARRDSGEIKVGLQSLSDESLTCDTQLDLQEKRDPIEVIGGVQSPEGLFPIGLTHRDVARIRLHRPDGTFVPVKFGEPSLPDGSRWFAAADGAPHGAVLVAYDAGGKVMATESLT